MDDMRELLMKRIDPLSDDIDLSEYVKKLSLEARRRYVTKLLYNYGQCVLPDPYKLKCEWRDDPSLWPEIDHYDIWQYLIESPGMFTRESLKAYKSLEAYRFVVSGHVQVVEYHDIGDDVPYCAVRAKVIPSQRVTEKPHQPWAYLHKETASVFCAHCSCLAGLGEVCSHVAALLFKMDIGVKLGLTCKAATSTACQWNSVFRKELEPMTVSQLQPLIKGSRTKPVPSVIPTSKDSLPDQSVLEALKKVCPDAVFFTTIPRLDPEETETASEEGDFQRCVQPLRDLYREHASNTINTDTATNIWQNYKCTEMQAKDLEKETRGQSVCPLWFEQRKGRITATKAHDVLVMKDSTSPDNLVRRITGSKCYNLSGKAAVKWGTTNEVTARNNYVMNERGNHQYLNVTTPGLMIDHRKPFLAVSSDGCVSCDCCAKRLLEIKCPYKHKDKNISQIQDKDFCLDSDGNLKKKHRYYTQIQMQMYVYNVKKCDLFIYTTKDSATVSVSRNEPFCEEMVRKCEQFFLRYVLPELVTRRLENTPVAACQVVSSDNKSNSCDEKKVWCLCQEPEYGRMIQCVNEDCPTQWFHYECVNIRRCPKGKWVCPECSDIKD